MSTATATSETDSPPTLEVPAQAGAPEVEQLPAADEVAADPPTTAARRVLPRQLLSWLGYVGCFVGAGLVGGGVVHRPLDPSRYTKVMLAGIVVFVLASLVNEVLLAEERPGRARLLRLLGCSLLLSVGIGMLSGGIQHFSDARGWAELMIAAGLVVSWLAYALRTGLALKATAVSTVAALALAAGVHTGLSMLPWPKGGAAHGGHGHGSTPGDAHGSAPADAHGAAPADAHGTAPTTSTAGAPTPAAEPDLEAELARLTELTRQLKELRARPAS